MEREDRGPVEENTHDYVRLVLDYACIGLDDAVSGWFAYPWALRIWTLTKIARTSTLTSYPGFTSRVCEEAVSTTAAT